MTQQHEKRRLQTLSRALALVSLVHTYVIRTQPLICLQIKLGSDVEAEAYPDPVVPFHGCLLLSPPLSQHQNPDKPVERERETINQRWRWPVQQG
jgi:hypothetical protein